MDFDWTSMFNVSMCTLTYFHRTVQHGSARHINPDPTIISKAWYGYRSCKGTSWAKEGHMSQAKISADCWLIRHSLDPCLWLEVRTSSHRFVRLRLVVISLSLHYLTSPSLFYFFTVIFACICLSRTHDPPSLFIWTLNIFFFFFYFGCVLHRGLKKCYTAPYLVLDA